MLPHRHQPGTPATDHGAALTTDPSIGRAHWIVLCAQRLADLRPYLGAQSCASLAQEMWLDVGSFDPAIAAEMEHETSSP